MSVVLSSYKGESRKLTFDHYQLSVADEFGTPAIWAKLDGLLEVDSTGMGCTGYITKDKAKLKEAHLFLDKTGIPHYVDGVQTGGDWVELTEETLAKELGQN